MFPILFNWNIPNLPDENPHAMFLFVSSNFMVKYSYVSSGSNLGEDSNINGGIKKVDNE